MSSDATEMLKRKLLLLSGNGDGSGYESGSVNTIHAQAIRDPYLLGL